MGKLAVLRLDGDLAQQGFRVALDIGEDGYSPDGSVMGYLPPAPSLLNHIQRWRKSYARLEAVTRIITPLDITVGNTVAPIDACKDAANQLAIAFQSWLQSEAFRPVDTQLRQYLHPSDTVRVLIRTEERSLHQLPWHLWDMVEQYPNAEVAFSSLQFQRCAPSNPLNSAGDSHTKPTKLRILAILGHRENIDIDSDRQRLEALPGAEVTFLVEPKRQELTEQLWAQSWDVLFFAGHSQTERSAVHQGRIFINTTDSLTLEELSYGLKQAIAQGLQLALFNSCDGLGLAYDLEPLNVPQLIVMREPVPDPVAQTFLSYFLQAFSQGKTLELAEREAREKLQALEGDFPCASWLPILFQQPSVRPLVWPNPSIPPSSGSPHNGSQRPTIGQNIQQRIRTYGVAIALSALIATGGAIGLRLTGLLQGLELWAFDRFLTLRPSDGPDPRLLIVEANEADIQALGHPLSDEVLTTALQTLEAAEPAVIGLDIFRAMPQEPGHASFLDYVQDSDRFVAVCQHSSTETQGFAPPPFAQDKTGFNDVVVDPDRHIRRHLLVMHPATRSDCTPTLSFSLLLALNFLARQNVPIDLKNLKIGAVPLIPIDRGIGVYQRADLAGYQLLLNYRPYQGSLKTIAQTVTLSEVLNGEVSPHAIRDRIVLIGVTSPLPKDDFATPHHPKVRGLIIHAHMVSQLISAVLDDRPLLRLWPSWGIFLWIGTWAITGSVLVVLVGDRHYRLWFQSGSMVILMGLCWVLLVSGQWVPLLPAAIAFISSSVILQTKYPALNSSAPDKI